MPAQSTLRPLAFAFNFFAYAFGSTQYLLSPPSDLLNIGTGNDQYIDTDA